MYVSNIEILSIYCFSFIDIVYMNLYPLSRPVFFFFASFCPFVEFGMIVVFVFSSFWLFVVSCVSVAVHRLIIHKRNLCAR